MLRRTASGVPARRLLAVVILLATIAPLLSRFALLSTRRFDPDEFEHMHVAWYISQGYLPYRDFFEMHPPVIHYLIAPVVKFFDTGTPDQAMQLLFTVRRMTWVIGCGIVLCTFLLARRLGDTETAWISMPLIATDIVVALRAIEIRPDGLSTVCWLTSLILMTAAMQSANPAAVRARRRFGLAGLWLGLGLATSQKLLMAGPALACLMVWYVSGSRFGATTRDRALNVGMYVLGTALPVAAVLAYFAAHGAGSDFLHAVLFRNLAWKAETSAGTILAFLELYDPWLLALAAGGAAALVVQVIRARAQKGMSPAIGDVVLLVATAGMFGGLFLTPVPFAQYCLTFLPLFTILAARLIIAVVHMLARSEARTIDGPATMVGLLVCAVTAVPCLLVARPVVVHPLVYPLAMVGALVAFITFARARRKDLALAVVVIALSVYPAQWMRWMTAQDDEGQFAQLRAVMTRTPPDGVVLDGFSGGGVFHRHAWYYWMLHPGVRAMLAPEDVADIERQLESGRVRPDVIVLDSNLRALSPRVTAFVLEHYDPTDRPDVFVRKTAKAATPAS